MPAFQEEIEGALEEGIAIDFLVAPVEVLSVNGRTTGLRCIRTKLGEPDDSGRRRALPVEGSEFVFEAETVISAIGQQADLRLLGAGQVARAVVADSVPVESSNLETSVKGVFAGGDLINGPASVVQAIADGKRAAAAIHFRLQGEEFSVVEQRVDLAGSPAFSIHALFHAREGWDPQTVVKFEDLEPLYLDNRLRGMVPVLEPTLRRSSFQEIVQPLDAETAATEAARCFFCGTCSACDRCYLFCPDICISDMGEGQARYVANPDYCKGCAVCAAVCPRGVMSMVEGL
jgi:Pyruvate/2-oxoacid:ferredoxin oxidoreductase delta subunit